MQTLPSKIKERLEIKIHQLFVKKFADKKSLKNLKRETKSDQSLVTEVDLYLSNLVKKELKAFWKEYTFVSEEEFERLEFPAVILDPIDGTKELSKGIAECSFSLGIANDKSLNNFGWIYNPFTGFSLSSNQLWVRPLAVFDGPLSGAVSRSEWQEGLFKNYDQNQLLLYPRGSIAFKLGLLAAGTYDFVYSKRPKNIWDIAAGTYLCSERGIKLFNQGKELKALTKERYAPPLCWCRSLEDYNKIEASINP